jgi:hypothetical protein
MAKKFRKGRKAQPASQCHPAVSGAFTPGITPPPPAWRADASMGSIARGERAGPAGHAVAHPWQPTGLPGRIAVIRPANLRQLQPHYLLFPVHICAWGGLRSRILGRKDSAVGLEVFLSSRPHWNGMLQSHALLFLPHRRTSHGHPGQEERQECRPSHSRGNASE